MIVHRGTRAWARLSTVMVLIAVVAVGLRIPTWFEAVGLRAPEGWRTYWREKAARDAWASPVTIQVTRQDDLATALARFETATVRPNLRFGLVVFVDPGGLHDAGLALSTCLKTDLDARGLPAREFLRRVLEPLGLACKREDGAVLVTSERSLNEYLFYGDHGEIFCNHKAGEWIMIKHWAPDPCHCE